MHLSLPLGERLPYVIHTVDFQKVSGRLRDGGCLPGTLRYGICSPISHNTIIVTGSCLSSTISSSNIYIWSCNTNKLPS